MKLNHGGVLVRYIGLGETHRRDQDHRPNEIDGVRLPA